MYIVMNCLPSYRLLSMTRPKQPSRAFALLIAAAAVVVVVVVTGIIVILLSLLLLLVVIVVGIDDKFLTHYVSLVLSMYVCVGEII